MSRAGYADDSDDNWALIKWRGQVESTIRGKRGQAFLRELIAALDALPEKKLIAGDLIADGAVCAIGAVGIKRGIDLTALDPYDYDSIAGTFGITHQLVREIEFTNDECTSLDPAKRWQQMRDWAERHLIEWDTP